MDIGKEILYHLLNNSLTSPRARTHTRTHTQHTHTQLPNAFNKIYYTLI